MILSTAKANCPCLCHYNTPHLDRDNGPHCDWCEQWPKIDTEHLRPMPEVRAPRRAPRATSRPKRVDSVPAFRVK